MDPLQWMGAVGMRVQTPDQNIAIIHMTPVNHLTSCKAKSCVFVRNFLSIIVMFLSAIWTLIMMAPIHCRGSNSPFSYMKNAGNQVVSCPIDFHGMAKNTMEVNGTWNCLVTNILQNILFYVPQMK